jgi:hypothetical protein
LHSLYLFSLPLVANDLVSILAPQRSPNSEFFQQENPSTPEQESDQTPIAEQNLSLGEDPDLEERSDISASTNSEEKISKINNLGTPYSPPPLLAADLETIVPPKKVPEQKPIPPNLPPLPRDGDDQILIPELNGLVLVGDPNLVKKDRRSSLPDPGVEVVGLDVPGGAYPLQRRLAVFLGDSFPKKTSIRSTRDRSLP